MTRYILIRLGGLAGVLLIVSIVTFILMHLIPGGPYDEEKMPLFGCEVPWPRTLDVRQTAAGRLDVVGHPDLLTAFRALHLHGANLGSGDYHGAGEFFQAERSPGRRSSWRFRRPYC